MKRYALFLMFCLFVLAGCTSSQTSGNPEEWTDEQLTTWFEGKEWLGTRALTPDPSIEKRRFATHYYEHKDSWDKAFAYLQNTDLSTLEPGNHEIDGKNVFAIISEYSTKDPEGVRYESHQAYTDLHCVISGSEYIGLKEASTGIVITPYNEQRDIAFYQGEGGVNLLASPGTFFIFFPEHAHRPGMKVEESIPVKKIVVKVKN